MSPFKTLINWSQQNFSHLPWRRQRSHYRTWISEVMLQQTTVATVAGRFEEFVRKFPNITALADAEEKEILSAWRGLGYYRRAANLYKGAQFIIQNHRGRFPHDESAIKDIPGIGEYTSAALIGIGRNRRSLPLDANLKRVLARYHAIRSDYLKKELQKQFSEGRILADMESLGPRLLIEALMDLGRVHCRATGPACGTCPLRDHCLAHKQKLTSDYGRPQKTPPSVFSLELLRVVVKQKNQILAYPKKEGEWLSGQWELPTFILYSEDSRLSQYPRLKTKISLMTLPRFSSRITRYRIQNHILSCNLNQFQKKFPSDQFRQFYRLGSRPCLLSSTTLKILDKIRASKNL